MMRWLLATGVLWSFAGCAYLPKASGPADASSEVPLMGADSVEIIDMAFDPMSLGPSVFSSQEVQTMLALPSASFESESPAAHVGGYRIQLGAYIDQTLAENLAQRAEADLSEPAYVVYDRPFYRVRVGNCRDLDTAEGLKSKAIQAGYQDARIAGDEIEIHE